MRSLTRSRVRTRARKARACKHETRVFITVDPRLTKVARSTKSAVWFVAALPAPTVIATPSSSLNGAIVQQLNCPTPSSIPIATPPLATKVICRGAHVPYPDSLVLRPGTASRYLRSQFLDHSSIAKHVAEIAGTSNRTTLRTSRGSGGMTSNEHALHRKSIANPFKLRKLLQPTHSHYEAAVRPQSCPRATRCTNSCDSDAKRRLCRAPAATSLLA